MMRALAVAAALLAALAGQAMAAGRPLRLVSLAPSITELVFAAGAGPQLAGVSAYSDYPPEAGRLPVVADAAGVSMESLLALNPDVVLAWGSGTRAQDIERLRSLGIRVEVLQVDRVADVPDALRAIGRIAATGATAGEAARRFEHGLAALEQGSRGKPPVRAFIEISAKPLMTVGGRHSLSDLLKVCGGRNVFESAGVVAEPSREALVAASPEVVLHARSTSPEPDYRDMGLALKGHAYRLDPDHAFRPGPRLLLAAATVCDALDRVRRAKAAGAR